MAEKIRVVTAAGTMDNTETVVVFNSASAINFQLLPSLGDSRKFTMKNIGAGEVTLVPYDEDTIDGASSAILDKGNSFLLIDYVEETWTLASAGGEGGIAAAYYSVTDPGVSAATTAAILDIYSGVIITTTAAGSAQTIATPTASDIIRTFVIINNDTSTNSVVVNTIEVYPGTSQTFIWDGSAWIDTDDQISLTPTDDTVGSGFAIKVVSTSSFQAVAAHKALQIEHTHTPSAAGTACPIAIVGKLTLAGDNTASNNYPGMGWGVQGQLHIATGTTIDGSTYGDPGAVYCGVRGVMTDAGTSTYTKGIMTCFYGDIQTTQNASAGANFSVHGMYLYALGSGGLTNVDSMIYIGMNVTDYTLAKLERGIHIENATVGIDIGTCTTAINVSAVQTDETGLDVAAVFQHGSYSTPLAYGTQTGDHLILKSTHITAGATGKYVIGDFLGIDTSATSTGYFIGGYNYLTVNHNVGAAMGFYSEVDITATAALNGNVSGLFSEICVTAGTITGAGKINGLLVEVDVTAGVTIAQEVHGIEVDMRGIKADVAGRTVGIKVTEAGGGNYLDYGMQFSNCFNTATSVLDFDLTQGNTACGISMDSGAYTITTGISMSGIYTTGINISGAATTAINFTGTYTGNVIDFSSATIAPTGSGGPCLLRAGTYGTPIDLGADEDQSGMLRFYSTTSAGGTSYDRVIFACAKTTGTKGVMPIAGLAEIGAQTGAGPTNVHAGQFIIDMNTSTSAIGASTTGYAGVAGIWAKIGSTLGSATNASSRIAAIWLDSAMSGTVNGESYMAWITSSTDMTAVFGIHSATGTGVATNLFYFDSTCDDQLPVVNKSLGVLLDTTQCYIQLSTAVDSFTTVYPIYVGDDVNIAFGASNDVAMSWTGQELLFEDTRTIDVSDGYNRTIHVGNTITMTASRYGAISNYTMLEGSGGLDAYGGKFAMVQGSTKAVDGHFGAVMAEVKNNAATCSTASALFCRWDNDSASGFGGAQSFIRFEDNSSATKVQNLLDLYAMDATTGASATEITCAAGAANACSHVIKILIGGVPYWIMMSSTPPA